MHFSQGSISNTVLFPVKSVIKLNKSLLLYLLMIKIQARRTIEAPLNRKSKPSKVNAHRKVAKADIIPDIMERAIRKVYEVRNMTPRSWKKGLTTSLRAISNKLVYYLNYIIMRTTVVLIFCLILTLAFGSYDISNTNEAELSGLLSKNWYNRLPQKDINERATLLKQLAPTNATTPSAAHAQAVTNVHMLYTNALKLWSGLCFWIRSVFPIYKIISFS